MNNPIPLLEELIKFDSSTKEGTNELIDYCHQWLEKNGLEVKKITNNGYKMLITEIGHGEETVVFSAHVDVVEGRDHQFFPVVKDDKMYGRGSVDMKAGAAAMMKTMVQLKDEDLPVKVMLQIVPDEETGGNNGTKYLTENGYLGDFIICGEPTHMGIAIQAKGVVQLDFKLYGRAAHSSRPWEGKNALLVAYDLYERILELPFAEETEPPFYDKPSINLAKIEGGTVYNVVPEYCEMALDIRYLPNQSPHEIIRQIKEITPGEITINDISSPVKTKEDNPFVKALEDSLTRVTQLEKANIYGQHGSNDGKYFTEYGGSTVEFGPVGYDWHGDKEMVYMESVKEYQEVLSDFVQNYGK